ncbi:MAG: hypothetical protein RL338_1868 [Chloroflexota bacterium]|jgi:hypothetical protein
MLAAPVIGLVVGWLAGGRLDRLAAIRFRWAALAVAGLLAQVVLFSTPFGDAIGPLAPVVYVVTTALVLAVVLRNLDLPAVGKPGLALVALGSLSNLAAIVANGGYMPADPGALAAAGTTIGSGYTNSIVVDSPALRPLTDVFALPAWIPLASVFSVGDVLIGIGIAAAIVAGMRRAG